jgi:carbonic anhydrase
MISDASKRGDKLCELNVIEQVSNVCQTTVVKEAWARGQKLDVHGWIYAIRDGLLRDLNITMAKAEETNEVYRTALAALR